MKKKKSRDRPPKKELSLEKKIKLIVLVSFLMGGAILLSDYLNNRVNFDGILTRREAGKGDSTQEVEVFFNDTKETKLIELEEQALDAKQVEAAFDKAINEIDETYLGENEGPDNVQYDLVLNGKYADGLVKATWQVDDYSIITTEGLVNEKNIPEDGQMVHLQAFLTYGESQRIYQLTVFVYPLGMDTYAGQSYAIEKAVEELAASDIEAKVQLPEKVEDMALTWKRPIDYRGLQLMLLGLAGALAVYLGDRQEKKKAAKALLEQRIRDYPLIVSDLSILMAAGMSFRMALEKIIGRYYKKVEKDKSKKSAGYEDMAHCLRRMKDGIGEKNAIEELGKYSDCKEYRKLSMLLSQNLMKGSKDLIISLENEEEAAFEMKKQRAIRAGEEASTKLLLPMSGMLFIVIVVLVIPAVLQINL